MKTIFISVICFLSSANAMRKECLLFNKKCVAHCPADMHPYHTRCDEDAVSQKSCAFPEQYTLGFTCGWSRCDCDGKKVMTDDKPPVCVLLQDCPPLKKLRDDNKVRRKKRRRTGGRRIRFPKTDMDELDNVGNFNPDDPERYTGHCPLLKFRYGKCYGDNTRQILREIRQKGLFNKPLEYRPRDNYEIDNMPRRDRPQEYVYDGLGHRQPAYMTGYTGYVPGMHFRYGKSYGRAADDCVADFTEHQRELRKRSELTKSYVRSRSAPKMETIRSRDEIRRELNKFIEINKYKENTISPEFPPIAGYTGHIPRIKGSEASLSQRYHCAAKRGLELIRMERDKRKELQNAAANVRDILREKEKKTSYWNWG